jgi:hypothetical protein
MTGLRDGMCALAIAGAWATALFAGCGKTTEPDSDAPPSDMTSAGTGASAAGMNGGEAGNSDTPTAGTSGGSSPDPAGSNGGGAGNQPPDDMKPDDVTPPPPEVVDMLDPDVDWEALTIVYPTMYSAYDGVHTFQVPAHVEDTNVELSGWQAIPADAAVIDPDPDVEGGVLITVQAAVEQITIAASAGPVGGTAALFITSGTPEQWEAGSARYANGVEFELEIDFAMLLDPNWEPPMPPSDLACNNCHTTGAKYFEIQHTPTQVARYSDDDLAKILTMGMKPEGEKFRVLPPMIGSMTAMEIYAAYHRWETTEDEVKGLILYLRSLTPTGQGDIRLPDGTYVPPGGSGMMTP